MTSNYHLIIKTAKTVDDTSDLDLIIQLKNDDKILEWETTALYCWEKEYFNEDIMFNNFMARTLFNLISEKHFKLKKVDEYVLIEFSAPCVPKCFLEIPFSKFKNVSGNVDLSEFKDKFSNMIQTTNVIQLLQHSKYLTDKQIYSEKKESLFSIKGGGYTFVDIPYAKQIFESCKTGKGSSKLTEDLKITYKSFGNRVHCFYKSRKIVFTPFSATEFAQVAPYIWKVHLKLDFLPPKNMNDLSFKSKYIAHFPEIKHKNMQSEPFRIIHSFYENDSWTERLWIEAEYTLRIKKGTMFWDHNVWLDPITHQETKSLHCKDEPKKEPNIRYFFVISGDIGEKLLFFET